MQRVSKTVQESGRGKRFILASFALISFFISSAFLFAQQPKKAEEIRLGQEFELKINQQAMIEDEGLAVVFESVLNDSRCPEGVVCVWSGNAKIRIKLCKQKQTPATSELNTDAGPKSSSYMNYEVRLVTLKPRPKSNEAVRPSEYKATLVIKKK
ncbi:MAG: hypothetical protein L0220_29105 [Acidobacteria bacterium]|nr:hypothetical protein [Acidobacteriota bacterium]